MDSSTLWSFIRRERQERKDEKHKVDDAAQSTGPQVATMQWNVSPSSASSVPSSLPDLSNPPSSPGALRRLLETSVAAMSHSQYTAPPPDYAPDNPSKSKRADHEPLLGGESAPSSPTRHEHGHKHAHHHAGGSGGPVRDAWLDDGEEGGVPADWSGMTVSQSSLEIRLAFIRKVYCILFLQIAASAVVGALCRTDAARMFILRHTWTVIIPLIGAIVSMLFLYAKRHSSPANLILLSFFTVLEALGIGAATAFVETTIVLEALVLTGLIFIGLTLYTFRAFPQLLSMGLC